MTMSNNISDIYGQQYINNNEDTVSTANIQGRLFKISKEITRIAVHRKKLQKWEEVGVGDFSTEIEAIKKVEESKNENGRMEKFLREMGKMRKGRIQYIKYNRESRIVKDILGLKIRYADREWKKLRKKYRDMKKEAYLARNRNLRG